MSTHIGKSSIKLDNKVSILETSSIVGDFEKKSPYSSCFDIILKDCLAGEDTWEKAESKILKNSIKLVINKSGLDKSDIDYIFSGDLLNQCSASVYAINESNISFFGIFGACSTFGEGLALGSIFIDNNCATNLIVSTSSHFCSAEKQFRFPLDLGTQRPPTSTRTVTGASSVILSKAEKNPYITGVTIGRIVDYGITDANNMGGAMAPAAADLIATHLSDFKRNINYYDMIVTGDLGRLGVELLKNLLEEKGYKANNIFDCGYEIFNSKNIDSHCGGSGCACSATMFSGYLYNQFRNNKLKRILFVPTGALMSSTSVQQGVSICGIAYGIVVENEV